jgi:uncharacterized protein HemY
METRDSRARFALLVSIAAQFAGFEKGERAVELAQSISDPTHRTAALSQIAGVLTLRREDDEARHALNAIEDDADRVFGLIGMSDAMEKIGDHSSALSLLEEASHLVETAPQLSARSSAYNEIARRFAEYGSMTKAAEICSMNLHTIAAIRDESSRAINLALLSDIGNHHDLELSEDDQRTIEKLLAAA